jgi:hypothetical protein
MANKYPNWTKAQLADRIGVLEDALTAAHDVAAKASAELVEAHKLRKIAAEAAASNEEDARRSTLEAALWRGRFEGACVASARMTAQQIDGPGQYREAVRDQWGNAL